jgi:hypothetical protein
MFVHAAALLAHDAALVTALRETAHLHVAEEHVRKGSKVRARI